jgi:flagellar biosynthesis protein FlhA
MSAEPGKNFFDPSQPFLNRVLAQNDVVFALGVGVVLATLLIPLPTFLLDLLLSCSIAVSISTLVIVLATRESIEFSTFPSLLLFVTLFRLSLNVASTRLILIQADAGQIINTFGNFVIGSNLIIGLVVFLILVVIQFVVITKGAERISEVAARFNLDAMPGKQMAIDADLNAGLIGEDDARARREKIVRESEFYGAMDGSSKFIRGDAIAGLIIVLVNLIGGIVVGMTNGMTVDMAMKTYSRLAIGDGLVSQIPAVIISTASGFLISKTSTQSNLSHDLLKQMLLRSRPLGIVSFLLGAMVFVPGFPKLPFIGLALGVGVLARVLGKSQRIMAIKPEKAKVEGEGDGPPVEELLDVDRLCVLVGARLIKTVDPGRRSSLSNRIGPLRRKFAQQFGVLLPLIRLRDNLTLEPTTYEIRLFNHVVGSGQVEPDKFLAMDPGTVTRPLIGQPGKEPVFNLPALWITAEQKDEAEVAGYTVVDPETILVTHLSEVLRKHAHEVLSRDDVQKLVDRLKEKQPALVSGVVGDLVPMGLLHRVLQSLLKDGIPIRDLTQILESLGEHATRTKDAALLTEAVRKSLVRAITEQHTDATGAIQAMVLEPMREYELRGCLASANGIESFNLAPDKALDLCRHIIDAWKAAMDAGQDKAVLLCDSRLRHHLAGLLARQLPQLPVVAYDEITPGARVESVGKVASEPRPGRALAAPGMTPAVT